jgi:hypothetical protein
VKAGVKFAMRYYFANSQFKKLLTENEAHHLGSLGIIVGSVFENGAPTTDGYFLIDGIGKSNAEVALGCAARAGQPKGSAIYFAADGDVLPASVHRYFTEVHNALTAAGYLVGVYGSGNVCKAVLGWGLCHYTWLAQSKRWMGYEAWLPHANIVQHEKSTLVGLDIDWDVSLTDSFGGWLAIPG